jgi:head-tail adaptor
MAIKGGCGKLRHLVSIEQPSKSQDSTGAEVLTWTEYAKAWAFIEPYIDSARFAGRELMVAGDQVQAVSYTRFRLRWIPGIVPKMRVNFTQSGTTRLFDILAVNSRDERNFELGLVALERK